MGHLATLKGRFETQKGVSFMLNNLSWIENIAPDFLKVIRQRYEILQQISWLSPVGRRSLAVKLGISERSMRTETEYLKQVGLIDIGRRGMTLTEKGEQTLEQLAPVIAKVYNVSQTESELAAHLQIARAVIVPGNTDVQPHLSKSLGEALNDALKLLLPLGHNIITVFGGVTMSSVASQLSPTLNRHRDLLFVPGRGGLGESVEIQSNTVCQMMANSTHSHYRTLYLPENVSSEAMKSLIKDENIGDVLDFISNSDAVIHSIGDAQIMAKRRGLSLDTRSMLTEKKAVAECFGYFFNQQSQMIYKIPRIGLQLEDLNRIPRVFAVASGQSKALAIEAYMKHAPSQSWLITDEGAANSILKGK